MGYLASIWRVSGRFLGGIWWVSGRGSEDSWGYQGGLRSENVEVGVGARPVRKRKRKTRLIYILLLAGSFYASHPRQTSPFAHGCHTERIHVVRVLFGYLGGI